MLVKHGEDTSTYLEYNLNLWLKAGATGGPDKNRVCGISMTMAQNIRSDCSILTVSTS
jgi:hypothetical protein